MKKTSSNRYIYHHHHFIFHCHFLGVLASKKPWSFHKVRCMIWPWHSYGSGGQPNEDQSTGLRVICQRTTKPFYPAFINDQHKKCRSASKRARAIGREPHSMADVVNLKWHLRERTTHTVASSLGRIINFRWPPIRSECWRLIPETLSMIPLLALPT